MYSDKQARRDWGIYIIILPDFSRTRLEDLLLSTGAPPEWRPEDEIMLSCVEDGHGGEESLDPPPRLGMV